MSSRWYPLYQKGNPQLRIFLPEFWMKFIQNTTAKPKNRIEFIVHDGMSKIDVKNYLEKIYNVPVVSVDMRIVQGATRNARNKQYIVKDDDYKMAYVTLPKDYKFEWPDLFPADKLAKELEAEKKQLDEMDTKHQEFLNANKYKNPNIPGWYH